MQGLHFPPNGHPAQAAILQGRGVLCLTIQELFELHEELKAHGEQVTQDVERLAGVKAEADRYEHDYESREARYVDKRADKRSKQRQKLFQQMRAAAVEADKKQCIVRRYELALEVSQKSLEGARADVLAYKRRVRKKECDLEHALLLAALLGPEPEVTAAESSAAPAAAGRMAACCSSLAAVAAVAVALFSKAVSKQLHREAGADAVLASASGAAAPSYGSWMEPESDRGNCIEPLWDNSTGNGNDHLQDAGLVEIQHMESGHVDKASAAGYCQERGAAGLPSAATFLPIPPPLHTMPMPSSTLVSAAAHASLHHTPEHHTLPSLKASASIAPMPASPKTHTMAPPPRPSCALLAAACRPLPHMPMPSWSLLAVAQAAKGPAGCL